jgi:predicted acetylornithine/succinylornithine family transaminase
MKTMPRLPDDTDAERQQKLIETARQVLVQNYRQQPAVMARGLGVELFDVAGNRYLDMTAGISVCALGHAHPGLRAAIADQAATLLHVSNLYFIEKQILAAEAIVERCFADRVLFCNSGAEANEAAIKLARRYQHLIAGKPERNTIVSTHGSFHGRTVATVAITGQEKYRTGFGPLFEPVSMVPFGDLAAAEAALAPETACAFIVEPIQAEGGIIVPPPGYLAGLRDVCTRTGTLLIFDEVQTGVGRTGAWFAHQAEGAAPDVMTLAKALGGGVPIGAVAATEEAARGLAFIEGGAVPHASTFGGNPLACAAAVAVIEIIEDEGLLENCRAAGTYLARCLGELASAYPDLAAGVRGQGLLQGLVMNVPAAPLVERARELGLLLSLAGGDVIRFAPPLNLRRRHIDEAVGVLDMVLQQA